jgi:hypothetical protein
MLFSFASIAVSLWLGLVAVAGIHRLWRAVAGHDNAYSNRDSSHSARGENHRDYHRDSRRGETVISIAYRSVISVLHAVINAIGTACGRTTEWFSRIFRRSQAIHSPGSQSLPISAGMANALPESMQIRAKSEPPKALSLDRPGGATKKKGATLVSRETSKTRRASSQANPRKIDRRALEPDAGTVRELGKDPSEKQPKKLNYARTKTAKKTARTKSPVSKAALTPKRSL